MSEEHKRNSGSAVKEKILLVCYKKILSRKKKNEVDLKPKTSYTFINLLRDRKVRYVSRKFN